MTLTVGQQTALEQPAIRFVYFAKFDFATAPVYVCSLNQTVTWDGHDWIGLGAVGAITPIDETQGTSASALTFQLNLAQAEWLALGVGDVAEYRGRDAILRFCPLDDQYRLVGDPVICWRGTMDTMVNAIEGRQGESTGKITLKCETSAYGLKRRPGLRMNAAQQKQRMTRQALPEDKGFDYLADLIANPAKWLSVKFQQQ